jgi:hypothetical protein
LEQQRAVDECRWWHLWRFLWQAEWRADSLADLRAITKVRIYSGDHSNRRLGYDRMDDIVTVRQPDAEAIESADIAALFGRSIVRPCSCETTANRWIPRDVCRQAGSTQLPTASPSPLPSTSPSPLPTGQPTSR